MAKKNAAPPVRGRANFGLMAFLAERLGVRKSKILIVGGATTQRKVVAVEGLSLEDAYKCLSD